MPKHDEVPKSDKATKPKAPQKGGVKKGQGPSNTEHAKRLRRNRAVKDPVERSEIAARKDWASGPNNPSAVEARNKVNLLKKLIEPKTEAMINVMEEIALDHTVHPSVRLDAASRLLDRAYGKPKEHVTIEDESAGGDSDEVRALLNNILKSVGAPLLDPPSAAEQKEAGDGKEGNIGQDFEAGGEEPEASGS